MSVNMSINLFLFLLFFPTFCITYVYVNFKISYLLKKIISGQNVALNRDLKRVIIINFVNSFCLIIIVIFTTWFIIEDFSTHLYLQKKRNQPIIPRELDIKYYTKPSRDIFNESSSLWVILNYPVQKGMDDYKDMGKGDGIILGEILLNGQPLINTKLSMILNGGSIGKDNVITNGEGIYEIKVPFGEYLLNAFKIYGSNIQDKIALQDAYRQTDAPDGKQIKFNLDISNNIYELPVIEIVDPVNIFTKEYTIYKAQELDENSKIFQWGSVKGASKYLIEISRVTRDEDGKTTQFFPISKKPNFCTGNNYLNFKEFKESSEYFEPGVYGIRIHAFNKDNKIITYSKFYTQIVFTE